jgi:polyvinyl alcohol dehydrogenase (cytochrome)
LAGGFRNTLVLQIARNRYCDSRKHFHFVDFDKLDVELQSGEDKIMKYKLILSALALITSPVWAASEPPEQALYTEQPAADNPAEKIYQKNCAICHNEGIAKAPDRTMLGLMSPVTILRAIQTGVMKEQASALSEAEKQLLAEHISGQSLASAVQVAPAPDCSKAVAQFDFDAPPKTTGWGVNEQNHRFFGNSINNINADNIDTLKLKWAFAFPGAVRARSQPAVAGGAIFVGSQDGTVYSLDQQSGCIRWQFHASAEVRTAIVIENWEAGSNSTPLAFFGDLVGNVYALDANTGQLVWRDRPDDHPSLTVTAAPALFQGRLYVSLSSLEVTSAGDANYVCCSFQGGVAIYEAKTGKKVSLIRSIDEELKVVGKNAVGTPQLAPSGSPIWNTAAVDTKRRLIYAATGENYSSPSNHTSDAILAFSMDDFNIVWSQQMTAGDAWNISCETPSRINCPKEDGPDYDFGAATILVTDKNGRDRVLAGQKSGEVFALDPDNGGKVLWRNKLGRGGIQGGVHFGMALDGEVLYVPMSDFDGGDRWPGKPFPGMFAVDISNGEVLWYNRWEDHCNEQKYCQPGISAAITAIDGAVVGGGMDGVLKAFNKSSGEVIWEFNSQRDYQTLGGGQARGGSFGGGAGPIFSDDMMYVNSGYGIYYHLPGNVMLAFELADSAVPAD